MVPNQKRPQEDPESKKRKGRESPSMGKRKKKSIILHELKKKTKPKNTD